MIDKTRMEKTDIPGGVSPEFSVSEKEESMRSSRSQKSAHALLVGFLAGLLGGILGWWMAPRMAEDLRIPLPPLLRTKGSESPQNPEKQPIITSSSEEALLVNLVEKSSKAVVSIVISQDVPKYHNFFDDSDFPFFFGGPMSGERGIPQETEKQRIGEGSGFFVSSDGTIVTNKHVVGETNAEYTVITSDKKEYSATVLARDPIQDIALLKISGGEFPALELANSDEVRVGQTAVAIGNSLGEFSNTVSRGIVSGLKRNLVASGSRFEMPERLSGIIQTDAAINPGNSGGPLLDLSGKVIGVNVAMAQGAQNIGFAIPVNNIKNALSEVKETGKISAPFLGVRYAIITPEIQKENSLPFDFGALVIRGERITDLAVVPGSPADKAGIVENDIILEIDGTKMNADNQLGDVVGRKRAGDTILMKIWHKGETKEIRVTLEDRTKKE